MWLSFLEKMDFVQKKKTTWVQEHSAGFWDWTPSFHIYSSCILYGTSCIQHICSYIYTNIYIFEAYQYIHKYRFFFKKTFVMPSVVLVGRLSSIFWFYRFVEQRFQLLFFIDYFFLHKKYKWKWPPACLSVDSCRLHFVGTVDRFCTWRKWRV